MASLSDILTAIQNGVKAVGAVATNQSYLDVQGVKTVTLTSTTLVKTGPGRLVNVSIIVGAAAGVAYDTNSVTSIATGNRIFIIPTSATNGIINVNLPFSNGLVVNPGAGQTIAVSYS